MKPIVLSVSILFCTWTAPLLADEAPFESIFDGKTLDGWDGNPDFWRVEEGTITGQTTKEKPTKGNTFLIWRGGDVGDFDLTLEYRIVGGNSGIQYRSFEVPGAKWVVGGYQADIDSGPTWTGTNYGERFRGVLAKRGDKTVIGEDHKVKVLGSVGKSAELQSHIKNEDWNQYEISARGFNFVQKINGHVMSELTDEDAKGRRASGILALQLHQGPPMKVQFRNLRLRRLPPKAPSQDAAATPATDKKKVVFVAGTPSHGYGAHEHNAGCLLLARYLQQAMPNFQCVVHRNGWPKDPAAFDAADAVVMYCDGGGRHMANAHLNQIDALVKRGVGIACLHYAVEVPKGPVGQRFLEWIGGYFETNWSVNPHWKAEFKSLPDHPVTRGVKPFAIDDEWYYHMRFPESMKGVTPILTALPPKETLSRPDGTHSGNPAVREAVLNRKEPQHVAWVFERPDGGGRGFGFTGGHFHWNWGDDSFRTTVLNAIVWIAGGEVPASGVRSEKPTRDDLEQNQDYPKPGKAAAARQDKSPPARRTGQPLFASDLISASTPGHAVAVDIDVAAVTDLYLVVTDGGDGYSCDWADWAEPRFIGPQGEKRLTDLPWKSASSQWGKVHTNRNAGGGHLRIDSKPVPYGIGTHANSCIHFEVPKGSQRFVARAGLDNGGTDQLGGANTSVKFLVYARRPQLSFVPAGPVQRTPEAAVDNLTIHESLQATLFAAEPMLLNPSNIDIDQRGRVWVCEIVNYRSQANRRREGDRILILEDTTGDGKADRATTFYQGRDIDSPHGICVLPATDGTVTRAIVSAGSQVLLLTDTDGDGRADEQKTLFTGISGQQHDHGIHAFVFGPDGKLYFNFGNAGHQLKDADGKPVVDLAGNAVNNGRQPYQEGMVFRCNLDGSEVETLGWNFRNNWMVTVDSFGNLWQSDNDDDGNRGVRINYVMEFGNYGYRDERTGAGWQSPRTGMNPKLPWKHWYQNDPGVVPNLLHTGAGSPTGITVYEGRLLPEAFRNQLLHCDAGPSVCRAYPVQVDGAGFTAEVIPILEGTNDPWFRPSDVSVAPDGSIFVADWYDPGVGGHRAGNLNSGRIFRFAPPNHPYRVPKFDFSTAAGAVEALKNPNYTVRAMAFTALNKMQATAEKELLSLWRSDDPRYQARSLWLLGKIDGRGAHYVQDAVRHDDPNLRIVGLRLARQLKLDMLPIVTALLRDPSAAVRRECAIALRGNQTSAAADLWAELALQYDGADRWYLEALGIAAEGNWDNCFEAWVKKVGNDWNQPAGRDIVWRSRAGKACALLATIVHDPAIPADDHPHYMRAFDFHESAAKIDALRQIAVDNRHPATVVEAVNRLDQAELTSLPPSVKTVLMRYVNEHRGTPEYLDLIKRYQIREAADELLRLTVEHPQETIGVGACDLLFHLNLSERLRTAIDGDDATSLAVITALGHRGGNEVMDMLLPVVSAAERPLAVRAAAVTALGRQPPGQAQLLALVRQGQLSEDLQFAAANALFASGDASIRAAAQKHLNLSETADSEPLPPIATLVRMPGNADRGKKVFFEKGTCIKCHKVGGEGKEVGPDLSEIGKKLGTEELYVSILDPNAGISHNYETYVLATDDGIVVTGVLVSQTDDEVTIKDAEGIEKRVAKDAIDVFKKQSVSLMPAGLQKTLSIQELVDLATFLSGLRPAQ